jgi:hypothetical protein
MHLTSLQACVLIINMSRARVNGARRSASLVLPSAETPFGKMRGHIHLSLMMICGYFTHTHTKVRSSSLWAILVYGLHHVVEKIGVSTLGLSLLRGRTFQTKTFFLLLLLGRLHSLLLLFDGGQSLLLDFQVLLPPLYSSVLKPNLYLSKRHKTIHVEF